MSIIDEQAKKLRDEPESEPYWYQISTLREDVEALFSRIKGGSRIESKTLLYLQNDGPPRQVRHLDYHGTIVYPDTNESWLIGDS